MGPRATRWFVLRLWPKPALGTSLRAQPYCLHGGYCQAPCGPSGLIVSGRTFSCLFRPTIWGSQNQGDDGPSMSWLQGVGWWGSVRKHLTGVAPISSQLGWGQLLVALPLRCSETWDKALNLHKP